MQSPRALVLDDDPSVRARTQEALRSEGIDSVAVASAGEALEVLRAHPHAVVVTVLGDGPRAGTRAVLDALCRLRAGGGSTERSRHIVGRSQASDTLRQRVGELAASRVPVLFVGEEGSGRHHAARNLHELSSQPGAFLAVRPGDLEALVAALGEGPGTVFVPSIEALPWASQERLAAALPSARARVTASIGIEPHRAADEGRISRALVAAFAGAIVPVPPLRERRADVAVLVRTFIEELRALNRLPDLDVAPDAMDALERCAWPGNVRQLRLALESAAILASEGTIRLKDLPDSVVSSPGAPRSAARADRRFRDAKRVVVEAFERAYLEDLLRRTGGNVTGAAEQSGMLRSALQRLLRKHDLHSADFRRPDASGPRGT
jgi:two-component system response regulator GlrR